MAESLSEPIATATRNLRVFSRKQSVIMLLICVVLWSSSGLFVKLSTLNPIALAGGRSAITAVVLLIYLRRPHFTWSRAQILGAVAMTVTFLLFISSTRLTSAANAILLQYTAPVWVALFGSWYLGEKARGYDWATMGVILLGMVLFFGDGLTTQGMIGNIMAIVSGITMAWMSLAVRKEPESAGETVLLGNTLTAVIGLPFLLVAALAGTVDALNWGILVYMGIFQLGIAFILYTVAVRQLPAIESILISMIEPILNPIWVFLVVGERPGPLAILGGVIVIAAVTVRALVASGAINWQRRSARQAA
jgi:drug/metabolite transporter (DMT)-like permease